jgi:arylsulfatase A-like enzyme
LPTKRAERLGSPRFLSGPSIVIISLDCVRPEALGCYPQRFAPQTGKPLKARTPNLDRLAAEGCRFDQVITQAPYTPAAHASLFTGLYPPRHGVQAMRGCKLTADATTLAEIARANGYQTAAFIGADALNRCYGLQRGFDLYDDVFDRKVRNADLGYRRFGDEITAKAIHWLKGNEAGRPVFLFLHYFDAHDVPLDVAAALDRSPVGMFLTRLYRSMPGSASDRYRRLVGRLYRRYFRARRAGRAYHIRRVEEIDRHIGQLLAYLQATGLHEDTLVALVADHGDAFGEHGESGHHFFVYDTTLKVPLIIKAGPQFSGRVVSNLTRLVDVMPTLCDLAGLATAVPLEIEGVSLVPLMLGANSDLSAYSETRFERSVEDRHILTHHFNSLRTARWKLIWNRLEDSVQLFDVEHDPDELADVSDRHPGVASTMHDDLKHILGRSVPHECMTSTVMTYSEAAEIEDRLRGLGYL